MNKNICKNEKPVSGGRADSDHSLITKSANKGSMLHTHVGQSSNGTAGI